MRTSSVCEQACELDSSKLSVISNWQCSEDVMTSALGFIATCGTCDVGAFVVL